MAAAFVFLRTQSQLERGRKKEQMELAFVQCCEVNTASNCQRNN